LQAFHYIDKNNLTIHNVSSPDGSYAKGKTNLDSAEKAARRLSIKNDADIQRVALFNGNYISSPAYRFLPALSIKVGNGVPTD
jgi:hypothetical protein